MGQFEVSEAWVQGQTYVEDFLTSSVSSKAVQLQNLELTRAMDSALRECDEKMTAAIVHIFTIRLFPSALHSEHSEPSKLGPLTANLKKLIMDPNMSSKSCGRFQLPMELHPHWVRHVTVKPGRGKSGETLMKCEAHHKEKNIFAPVTPTGNCQTLSFWIPTVKTC